MSLYYGNGSSKTPTKLVRTYSLNSYYITQANFKYSSVGNTVLTIQAFGTDRIEFSDMALLEDYEYILTSSSAHHNWSPNQSDLSSDYYLRTHHGDTTIASNYYFTVNKHLGVGYFHPGSTTTPTYTKTGGINLYVWRKRPGDPSSTWTYCGYTLWDPLLTQVSITWNGNIIIH